MLEDTNTKSLWSPETGEAVQGTLTGSKLERVESLTIYWAIWARFHPKTGIIALD